MGRPETEAKRRGWLSREQIAHAAMTLVEREGAEALTMRRVARELGVAPMSLYTHVAACEDILTDVVRLMTAEIDTLPVPGERWDDTIRRTTASIRAVCLRHPQVAALSLFRLQSGEGWTAHAARVFALHEAQGIPEEMLVRLWALLDAFLVGFLSSELRGVATGCVEYGRGESCELDRISYSDQAFRDDIEMIIAGIRAFVPAGAEWRTPAAPAGD